MQTLQIKLKLEAEAWRLVCVVLQIVDQSTLAQTMLRKQVFLNICRDCGYQEQFARIFSDLKSEIEMKLAEQKDQTTITLWHAQVAILILVIGLVYEVFLAGSEDPWAEQEIAECDDATRQLNLLLGDLLSQIPCCSGEEFN